jgi:glutathione S-transferase
MLELYQAEWCPHSRKVRQRLTELGKPFLARQVEADPRRREAMRAAVGSDVIPVLVLEDGPALAVEDEEIIAELDRRFAERADAGEHREKAREHEPASSPG